MKRLVTDPGLDLEVGVEFLLFGDPGDDLRQLCLLRVAADRLRKSRANERAILDREDGEAGGDRDIAEECELVMRCEVDFLDDRLGAAADDLLPLGQGPAIVIDDRDLPGEPDAGRHLVQIADAHLVQRHVAEPTPGPGDLLLDAEVVPLGGQPEVLEGRGVPRVVPAVHADLQAAEAVNLFLALEVGQDLGELVDRATFADESGVLGVGMDRLGPTEVGREGKAEPVVGQRQGVRRVDVRVLEATQVDVHAVAGNHRAGSIAVIGGHFLAAPLGRQHPIERLAAEVDAVPLEDDATGRQRIDLRGVDGVFSVGLASRDPRDVFDVPVFRLLRADGRDDRGHPIALRAGPGLIRRDGRRPEREQASNEQPFRRELSLNPSHRRYSLPGSRWSQIALHKSNSLAHSGGG